MTPIGNPIGDESKMETTVEIDKKNYGRRSEAEFLAGGEQMWGILQFLTEQKH